MPLKIELRQHSSTWRRTRVLRSTCYGSAARKTQRFEMVFLTSNVFSKSTSMVLNCGEPVLKAKFPLSQNDVATAFLEWQLSLPELGRKTYTIDQFTNQLIAAQPHLRVAPVTKLRRRFSFAGCIAEFVRLSVDSLYLESFSLEHEQTGPIVEALNDLGLVNVSNINYPLALKRALGLEGDTQNSNRQGAARA